MKHLLSILLTCALLNSYSQCNPSTEKMMVIGDSWAFFGWTGNSYNENLDRFGFSDVSCYSTPGLAVNGAEASDYFTDAGRVQELENYILSNPELEYVHMSLGGNDALGTWHKNYTSQQTSDLLDVILIDIRAGIDTILSFNPNLNIVLAGYDYPNFSETIGTLPAPAQPFHPYYDTWNDMGQPNPEELNGILQLATDRFLDSAAIWDNVYFENNLGLMQWVYGQIDDLQVAPFGSYPANTAPVPGGYPDYPSPLDALNFGGQDSFHLNDDAYEQFLKRYFSEFYWARLRDYHQTISANDSSLNGTLTASGTTTTSVTVGNDNLFDSDGLLSFDTWMFNDTYTLESASIFIQRDSAKGDDLNGIDIDVEIKSGYFGSTINLENDDFAATGNLSATLCAYGTIDEDGHWLRIDLDPSMFPYIDRLGTTQFKLSYSIADTTRFIAFGNGTDQILLDARYTENPTVSVNESELSLKAYPNPTSGLLTLDTEEVIQSMSLFDLNGKKILTQESSFNKLDLSRAANGVYILKIAFTDRIEQIKVIKE